MSARPYWQESGEVTPPGGVPPPIDLRERVFEVRYDPRNFSGESVRNLDLGGRGVLTVAAGHGAFRFTGKERKLFGGGGKTLEFSAADITDVVAEGNVVHFATAKGLCGEKHTPFHFYAKDAMEAVEIARLLPATQAPDGARAFAEKLGRLPSAAHPLASVTNLLVLANVGVFAVMVLAYGADFLIGKANEPFLRFGASNGAAVADGEWWRIPVSMFMHFGFWHLVLNMWALFQAGTLLERLLGRPLFSLAYLASGLGGGLASIWWHGDKVWSAGASGAVFGVYGATLGVLGRLRGEIPIVVMRPMVNSMVFFAGYNLLYGASHAGIDNACHVGGLLTGLLMGAMTALPLDPAVRAGKQRGRLIAGAALLAGVVIAGSVAAPRFDYRMREELALQGVLQRIVSEEKAVDTQFRTASAAFDARRISLVGYQAETEKFLAFSTRYQDELKGLALTPGMKSDRTRSEVMALLQKKATAGELALKLAGETTALAALTAGFDAEHRHQAARVQARSGDEDTILWFLQEEWLPSSAQWEAKLRALPLTDSSLMAAREKALAAIASHKTEGETMLRGLQELMTWRKTEQEFVEGYNGITRRVAGKQSQAEEALAVVEKELLPYLAIWEARVAGLAPAGAQVQEARQRRLNAIREAIVTQGGVRDRFRDVVLHNHAAAEFNRLVAAFKTLDARGRDQATAALAMTIPGRKASVMLREDLLPAYEALAANFAQLAMPDEALRQDQQRAMSQVKERINLMRAALAMAEQEELLKDEVTRILAETGLMRKRMADAARRPRKEYLLFLKDEAQPSMERWLRELKVLELPAPEVAEARTKIVLAQEKDLAEVRAALAAK